MSEGQRSNRNAGVQAQELLSRMAKCRLGEITEYDPEQYAVKVMIQPEGFETGWIPIKMLSGADGWGVFIGPDQGAQAILEPVEGSRENFVMIGVLPSDDAKPPSGGPPSGEIWMVHKEGGLMQFKPAGLVVVQAATYQVEGVEGADCALTVKGTIIATGNIVSSAEVRGATDVKSGSVSLRNHRHGGVTTGGAQTGTPV